MAGVAGFVSGVKTRLAVDNATTTSDDPTPIYVLDELVSTLSAGDTRAGVDAVCARLAHRSPAVKQKALKLVTHIGRKGSPDLRRLMARHSGAVRDLLHYRCEPDPFKGDTVWKRVQEYAQEALEAVHSTGEASAPPSQSALGNRIQGFGSEGAGGGGGSGSGMLGFGSESAGSYGGGGGRGGSRMVGFGSADVMQGVASGLRSLTGNQDGYSSSQLDGGSSRYSSGAGSRQGLAPGGGFSQPIVQAAAGGGGAAAAGRAAAPAAAAAAGGEHAAEQRLVDRICTPAGLRAAPGSEDLRAFVEGLSPLDGPAVARLLERKLEAGPWQATLRALCAIEAVVEGGSSTACGQVAVHFQAHPEAVRRAAGSPHASVRQRANKLLSLLGDAPAAAGEPGGQQQQQQQAGLFTEDLLGEAEPAPGGSSTVGGGADLADLLGEPAPPAAPAATAGAPPAPPAAAAMDLLAGLEVAAPAGPAAPVAPVQQLAGGAATAPPPAAAADDLFGSMLLGQQQQQQPAALASVAGASQPAAAPPHSDLDLLAGLSLGGGSSSMVGPSAGLPALHPAGQPAPLLPPTQQRQQHQQASSSGGMGDLLGGLSLGQVPAGAAAGAAAGAPMLGGGGGGGGGFPMSAGMGAGGLGAPMYAPGPAAGVQNLGAFTGGQGPAPHLQPLTQQQQNSHPAAFVPLGGGVNGLPQHGRQPSLNSVPSGAAAMLGTMGILDSAKDNSFNFVDDAIAAARRKQ